jgi:hypothetical protein
MEHLSTALRKGGVKDMLAFFPQNKRQDKFVDEHFRNAGLPQVAEWWTKKQYAALKENIISGIKEALSNDDSHDEVRHDSFVREERVLIRRTVKIVAGIKAKQEERPLPDAELIHCIWQGLISSVEWSARQDQNDALAVREVGVCHCRSPFSRAAWADERCQNFTDILEPFCNGAKTEVALINAVQVYSYEDTRIIKAFPQILKVCGTMLVCSTLRSVADIWLYRFCITRTVFLIKLLYIGTRRARSLRESNIFSLPLNPSLRCVQCPLRFLTHDRLSHLVSSSCRSRTARMTKITTIRYSCVF